MVAEAGEQLAIIEHALGAQFAVVQFPLVGRFGLVEHKVEEDALPLGVSEDRLPLPQLAHVVVEVEGLSDHPVTTQGKSIRWHNRFSPEGTNANFVKRLGPDRLALRTYERGVEDETLACGTGAIASALVGAIRGRVDSPVTVETRGGEELIIHFDRKGDAFERVWLEGSTTVVYEGRLNPEALEA